MTRPIGLHHINTMDVDAVTFIDLAGAAGAEEVSVFTNIPKYGLPGKIIPISFPTVNAGNKGEVMARLAATGVRAIGAEYFPISELMPLTDYQPGVDLAAEIGCARLVTHIHDPDENRAVDQLGVFCEMAAAQGMSVNIEFMGLSPTCGTVKKAAWFVEQVGAKNLGIGMDALHLIRTGGTAADIADIPAHYFGYAQICDCKGTHASDDYVGDGMEREIPGKGDWPLKAIFEALPASCALEAEIPSELRKERGVPAGEHLKYIYAGCRTFVDGLRPTR